MQPKTKVSATDGQEEETVSQIEATAEILTEDNYAAKVEMWSSLCLALRYIPRTQIDRAIEIVNYFETIGPFYEPTLFIRGGAENLAGQKKFLHALKAFEAVMDEIVLERVAKKVKYGV